MFAVCNKLERLNLSNFDTEYVIGTEDMFSECFNLPQSIKDKIVNIQ
jgi:surface protein